MSENLSPVTTETSDTKDDADSPKSKSKKKALGAFLVETEPPKNKESASLWSEKDQPETTLFGKRRTPEAPDTDDATDTDKTEKLSDQAETLVADELSADEKVSTIQQLAAARRAEVETEGGEADTVITEAELAAAAAFLTAAEALGDSEAAYQQIASELGEPLEAATDTEIDTEQLHEGEIDLHAAPAQEVEESNEGDESTSDTAVTAQGQTTGRGGTSSAPSPTPPPVLGGTAGPRFNAAPAAPTVVTPESSPPLARTYANERRAAADGLIVGGVVGYLYGRRRGRIKTEKRLAPVQRKLEKQVKVLQSELLQAETVVRQQARRMAQERPQVAAQVTERFQRVVRQESIKQPERQVVHAPIPPERIGHVLVAASAIEVVERSKKPTKQESLTAKKRAETMSRGELLELSATVQVDDTSLRQIYETQLISEKGLRRLVTEHLRGGNVARALRRELVEHQIDFERDPILRDRGKADASGGVNGAGKTALSGLLAQAGVSDQPEPVPIGPITKKRESKDKKAAAAANKKEHKVIDGALITLITLLVLIIVAILMRSH